MNRSLDDSGLLNLAFSNISLQKVKSRSLLPAEFLRATTPAPAPASIPSEPAPVSSYDSLYPHLQPAAASATQPPSAASASSQVPDSANPDPASVPEPMETDVPSKKRPHSPSETVQSIADTSPLLNLSYPRPDFTQYFYEVLCPQASQTDIVSYEAIRDSVKLSYPTAYADFIRMLYHNIQTFGTPSTLEAQWGAHLESPQP